MKKVLLPQARFSCDKANVLFVLVSKKNLKNGYEECSGSVVGCLTRSKGWGFEPHLGHCIVSFS